MSHADVPGRNPLPYSIRDSQRTPRTARSPAFGDTRPTQHQPTAYHASKAPADRFLHRFPPTTYPSPPKSHGSRSHPRGYRRDWRCMIHIRAFLSPPNEKPKIELISGSLGSFVYSPIIYFCGLFDDEINRRLLCNIRATFFCKI